MSSSTDYNFNYGQIMTFVYTSVLIIICICGVIGNAIVLGVGVLKQNYKKNVTNCYIMNLAITDLFFLLISVPFTTYLGAIQVWSFGQFVCKMHIYIAHVLLQATCYTLAAMSIDRYLNIVHEMWYRKYRKSKYAQIICLFIWIVSLVFMFPYEYFLHVNNEKNNQSSHASNCIVQDGDSLFSSCIFTLGFYYVLPLLIIGICYLRVLMYVRRSGYRMVKRLSGVPRQSIELKSRRVQRMLLALTLAFALCWLPIHVLEFLSCSQLLSPLFHLQHYYTLEMIRAVAHALSYFNSCLNPFLYASLNKSFFYS
ncbi:unnamed protein product [Adineta steineri]|uniref:G-protein coupled receptors family 1 profile domain-containing protein n=1 Tax=Adineta steineri TaxID=433720 RepID=A0A814BNJ6_9BILA|nr:unnamed protein product [Adineta steineri]CAF4057347.1 unnamed protein product [Adineta steineri]